MQPIIIKRATRPDIRINDLDDLTPYLSKTSKQFKRVNDNNSRMFTELFGKTFGSTDEFKKTLKKILGISGSGSNNDQQILMNLYGWEQQEFDVWKNFLSNRTKNFLSREGISPEEFHQRNSHFNKKYWVSRGMSEEEASAKVSSLQSSISRKATKQTKSECSPLSEKYVGYVGLSETETKERISHTQKTRSKRCVEYWLARGHSETEARNLVTEHQLEWISKKTPEELDSINKRKSNQLSFSYLWDTVEDQTTELSGNFYIIKLREGLYKIGITTKPSGAFARYRKHDLDGREVILNESLSTIREAFRIEQIMRREFNGRIKKENAVGVFGWTETIEIDEETLLDKYKNLFENKEKTKQIFANIRNKQ